MKITLFFLSLMFSVASFAAQITEDFSKLDQRDVETGIWNIQLGKLTPHLMVANYGNGSQSDDFSVGDGSDGVFDISTYAKFSVGGNLAGQIIRLDQTKYPTLNLTRFHLAAGWFLEPANNLPLKIFSQGDVLIDGEIWCHGRNGSSGAAGGGAGTGRCGGGNGGAGGASGAAGGNGDDIATGPNGGNGGGPGSGGGGGGGYDAQFAPPSAGAGGAGGAAGTNHIDHAFTSTLGAAAGGGGGGAGGQFGGGGGGGAGAVIIHAARDVLIGASGLVRAYGGTGGAGVGASGSGGSGGSGSVQIFAGRDIDTDAGNPAGADVNANQVAGGTGGAANGGAGGFGRTWMASAVTFNLEYSPNEDISHTPGNIEYFVGTDTFETKSFEIRNSDPSYLSVTSSPSDPAITFLVKASNDNFATDDTGWVAVTDPSLADRRFFKLQISLTNASPGSPLTVDSVTLDYDGHTQNEFNFTGAGCGRVAGSSGGTGLWLLLPFLLLLQVRRTFLIVGASILFLALNAQAAMPVCDENIIKQQCAEMKASPKQYFEFGNGIRMPNPFRVKELKDQERYAQAPLDIRPQKKRIEKIFNEAKESIIQSLLKGRTREALSPAERSMVIRVERVVLQHGDHEDVENDFECAGNAVNAGYMPDEGTIHACRGIYEYPDLTLYHILGHEIGHSIDSCNLTKTLVQEDGRTSPYSQRIVAPSQIRPNQRILAEPMKDDQIPYREIRQCLIQQSGFQQLSTAEREEFIDRIARERVEINEQRAEDTLAKHRSDVTNEMAGIDCPYGSMNKISHLPEVIADVFGAVAVDRFLQSHPEAVSQQKLSTFYNWRYLCDDVKLSQAQRDEKTPKWQHPLTVDRYMKIMMQVPRVAEGMGCAVDPKYSCFKSMLSAPKAKEASSGPDANLPGGSK